MPTTAQTTVSKPRSALMHPGPGFRVRQHVERPEPEILSHLGTFATPDISDLMNRLYTMVPEIHNLTRQDLQVLGPACTVKVFPGDNLMVHKALDIARRGDIIIVDAGSSPMNAVLGDLICTKARHRGIAGFVVDGLIRDLPNILALEDFPVFARGVTPIGPLQRGPGEVNFPVSAGGIVVNAGDIVVGDLNGVVVVPRLAAEDVIQRLTAKAAAEADYLAAVTRGNFSNAWVDDLLRESGVRPVDVVEE